MALALNNLKRVDMLLNKETKAKTKFLMKKSFLRNRGSGGLNKKRKEGFLSANLYGDKEDPTTSIRKRVNENCEDSN